MTRPLAVLLGAALLAGCITEEVAPRRGMRVRPDGARASGEPVSLPEGPIASPAVGATSTARVRVEVLPLGTVQYDGQVLPLVSPDGRFLAVQSGEAPTWETLLARPGAIVPIRTSVVTLNIAGPAPVPVVFPQPLPTGVMLGRSCDDSGFLVEWPRADGSRWIGHADWVSGRVMWLAQGDAVNAHGVLLPTGELLYTRRVPTSPVCELVLRGADGSEDVRADPNESYLLPMATGDLSTVYTLVESAVGLELAAIGVPPDPSRAGRRKLGALIARTRLDPVSSPELAYQVTAAVPPAPPARSSAQEPGRLAEGLVVLVPRAQRMGRFDPATGSFDLLPAQSVAAAVSRDPAGYFAATPEGMVFVSDQAIRRRAADGSEPPSAAVLADPFVPRATTNPNRPFVLIGPIAREPNRLRLMAMSVPAPDAGSP